MSEVSSITVCFIWQGSAEVRMQPANEQGEASCEQIRRTPVQPM